MMGSLVQHRVHLASLFISFVLLSCGGVAKPCWCCYGVFGVATECLVLLRSVWCCYGVFGVAKLCLMSVHRMVSLCCMCAAVWAMKTSWTTLSQTCVWVSMIEIGCVVYVVCACVCVYVCVCIWYMHVCACVCVCVYVWCV